MCILACVCERAAIFAVIQIQVEKTTYTSNERNWFIINVIQINTQERLKFYGYSMALHDNQKKKAMTMKEIELIASEQIK